MREKLSIPEETVFHKELVVGPNHLASVFGSGRVDVLATPFLVAFIEGTCNEGMQHYHDSTYVSVGAVVNINHLKPTPLGMMVTCHAKYLGTDENNLYIFDCEVYDEVELVATCYHKRGLVNHEKFMKRVNSKGSTE